MKRLVNEPMTETMRKLAQGSPPGAFVEVGVYQGGTAVVLHEVAQSQGRALYLFDTFSGMPVSGALDVHKIGDFADCDPAKVERLCPNAIIVPGIFPDSLVLTGPIAFVHADADQYETTRAICLTLAPRMVNGGLMLFDDYDPLPGCRLAVDEFFGGAVDVLEDGRALIRFDDTFLLRLAQRRE